MLCKLVLMYMNIYERAFDQYSFCKRLYMSERSIKYNERRRDMDGENSHC